MARTFAAGFDANGER
jgi:hypothetical protein